MEIKLHKDSSSCANLLVCYKGWLTASITKLAHNPRLVLSKLDLPLSLIRMDILKIH